MRVAFAGTPEFAAEALRAILAAGYDVPLVLTQPDRPAGRGMQMVASPVKQLALQHGIPVDQPEKLRTEEQQATLRMVKADVIVVAAYGLILPQAVLDLPRFGCVNIHASLLPRWRGAAPIHRAIEAGDRETGITIMQMDAGLDTGDMLLRRALPIDPADTTATLHDKLAVMGGELIVEALPRIALCEMAPAPQPAAGVTYAAKITKAEAAIDFRQPAELLARRLRAFDPFPGGVATLNESAIKLWKGFAEPGSAAPGSIVAADAEGVLVGCGQGLLRLTELQKPGGKRLAAGDFLRGLPLQAGAAFALPQA
ncbi:methionyl-tRNA formyltransferase [Niveibacterium umoris]|uniref:Methionyl-tRNA formyltransferase n=1 Tax=Niveibacterium umoris TaxID=1193620 RepID=A0A840BR30_9RHOO|nr:methionyl-tRNA formyltransferase [Niveibacterium umoris]MBB4013919.1 methionyl-tRNA formyltransferase [Niveibacterium umoris]